MTITIQAGNTDNKLTQQEWYSYVYEMNNLIRAGAACVIDGMHFFGGSSNWEPWQNVCWVVEFDPRFMQEILGDIKRIRQKYKQESVAVTTGNTEFI